MSSSMQMNRIGPRGPGKCSSSSASSGTRWAWETSGDFHTCANRTAEVSGLVGYGDGDGGGFVGMEWKERD